MQLIAEDLRLYRGTRLILKDLSFAVRPGEALILTGPNGAGKTTLIRALAGFLPLAAGTIRLEGSAPDAEIAESCHFIGHRDAVKSGLTVEENATFYARYLGASAASPARPGEAVHAALERLGLAALAEAPAAWLSAGQRRRLGLSRLLLAKRPVWLLDEPTVSLDAASVATLSAIIATHQAAGGIVVAATHIPLGLSGARELRLAGPASAEDRP